ncbi:5109_t:CDS:2, partial [Diversispora eburnea]
TANNSGASAKAHIDDQSARTIVYNEIKSLLFDITDVNLLIGVTNCHVHMSDLSSLTDSSAELARSKLSEIEVSKEASPETEISAPTEIK